MSRYVFYIMLNLSLASLPFVAQADQSPAGQEGEGGAAEHQVARERRVPQYFLRSEQPVYNQEEQQEAKVGNRACPSSRPALTRRGSSGAGCGAPGPRSQRSGRRDHEHVVEFDEAVAGRG